MGKEFDSDLYVAKAAVERGFVSQPQVMGYLKELGASALYKSLGELLVAKGHLSGDQLDRLHHELDAASPPPAPDAEPRTLSTNEALFGQLLVKRGYASADQIKEALRLQAAARAANPNQSPRLGDILIQRGMVNLTQIEEILELSKKLVKVRCDACSGLFNLIDFDPHKSYHCKRTGDNGPCGGTLQPVGLSTPKHASIAASHVPVPDEVRRAASDHRKVLGKYVLLGEIGRGGMGVVYRAWDAALNREVAVKVLLGTEQGEEEVQRFYREAQTAATLHHPNIAAVYDVGESDGKYFIALQYIDGKNLAGQHLTHRRAADLMRKVALAVDFAHHAGIVHRDLKPQNILLNAAGDPFVMDFGLAKSLKSTQITQTGSIMGTPAYMAPEQAEGNARLIGRKTDVYALGATLYELLTGRAPFSGDTPFDIMMHVVNEEPVPPTRLVSTVPPEIETIVLKAMEKDPARRYASAKSFADDLERWLSGDPILARPASLATVVGKRIRKNRAVLVPIVVALVLLVAVAGSVTAIILNRRAEYRRLFAAAEAAYQKGDYDAALLNFEKAGQLDASDPDLRKRIDLCVAEIDRRRAIAESEKTHAAAQAEASKKAHEARLKKLADAAPDFNKGRQVYDESRHDLYRKDADLGAMRQRLLVALGHFDKAVEICEFHADAFYYRGLARLLRFEIDDAEKDFTSAVKHEPKHTLALIARGRLYAQRYADVYELEGWKVKHLNQHPGLEWRDKALADFRKAAESGDTGSQDFLAGLVALAEQKYDDAAAAATKAIAAAATNEEAYRLRGEALYWKSWRDRLELSYDGWKALSEPALADFNKALDLRVNYFEVLKLRGALRFEFGQFDDAAADFQRAFVMNDVDPLINEAIGTYWCKQAQAALSEGKTREARAMYDEGIGFYGRSISIRPSYRNLQARGAARIAIGDVRGSLKDLDRAYDLNPTYASTLYHRGWAYSLLDQLDRSIHDLDEAVKFEQNRWLLWHGRGIVLAKLNRTEDAIASMERALKCDPPPSLTATVQIEADLAKLKAIKPSNDF